MRTFKIVLRWLLTLAFCTSGVFHFVQPEPFVNIMPAVLPAKLFLVYISGAAEIAGGIGLQIPRLRRAAAWGLFALLIAIFPANINQAVNHIPMNGQEISPVILWGRLPIQFLLLWAVWWYTRKDNSTSRKLQN